MHADHRSAMASATHFNGFNNTAATNSAHELHFRNDQWSVSHGRQRHVFPVNDHQEGVVSTASRYMRSSGPALSRENVPKTKVFLWKVCMSV